MSQQVRKMHVLFFFSVFLVIFYCCFWPAGVQQRHTAVHLETKVLLNKFSLQRHSVKYFQGEKRHQTMIDLD